MNTSRIVYIDYTFLALSFIILIVLLIYWRKARNKKARKTKIINIVHSKLFLSAKEALNIANRNLELEHAFLRSQMNPHFIFNSLTAIQNYVLDQDVESASKYLDKFSELMEITLNNSKNEFIPFHQELNTLKLYLDLQKVRFEERFDYFISVDANIDPNAVEIPPMLTQPFIENALEHGLRHKAEKGLVHIKFFLQQDTILFEVEDDGIGLEKSQELNRIHRPHHNSYATKLTEERLALIQGKENEGQLVTLENIVNENNAVIGTRAKFEIPFQYI